MKMQGAGRWRRAVMLAGALVASATPAFAQDDAGFQAYMATLRQQAIAQGVTARTADAVFPTLTLNQRVIDLDRGQPGGGAKTGQAASSPPFALRCCMPLTAPRSSPPSWRQAARFFSWPGRCGCPV